MEENIVDITENEELPKKIKLELKTPLETFFFWGALLFSFLAFMGVIAFFDEGKTAMTRAALGFGIGGMVIFISLYRNTDNYYILDIPARRILYHFKFYSIKKLTEMMRFEDVIALTVSGKRESSKSGVWWEYQTVLLRKDGKIFPLSDRTLDSLGAFSKNTELAHQIAQITGARFIEGVIETYAEAEPGLDGSYSFKHVPHTGMRSFKDFAFIMGSIFAVVALAILGAYLIGGK